MDFRTRGIGGEIKLFPPPVYHRELEKWEDWSWQLKRYLGLRKPLAKLLMDEVEGSNGTITEDLCEAFNVQQNRTQNDQLSLFARQLASACIGGPANPTCESAPCPKFIYWLTCCRRLVRAIVRNEDTENGFAI